MTEENNDFSRFELMLIHRLGVLETLTKEQHKSFEDLRVDFVTLKSNINTRVTVYGGIFAAAITIANLLLKLLGT